MKNKKQLLTLVAVITAVIGAIVALAAVLKRKARDIGEKLDYDGSLYYEDEDPLEEPAFVDGDVDESPDECIVDAPAADCDVADMSQEEEQ